MGRQRDQAMQTSEIRNQMLEPSWVHLRSNKMLWLWLCWAMLQLAQGQFHPVYAANLGDPLVKVKLLKGPNGSKSILAFPNRPGPFPGIKGAF